MPMLFPPEYPDRPDAPLLSFGPSFSEEIARSVIAAVWYENPDQPHETEVRVAASLTMLEAFHPRDHLECMLAAQGVATHAAIMDCFRRAMDPEVEEAVAIKLRSNASQLSRTFSTVLHDLERRQSKPLPERPSALPLPDGPPPTGFPPSDPPAKGPRGKKPVDKPDQRPVAGGHSDDVAKAGPAVDGSGLPDDIEVRPDGTPGSLAAYAPKAPPPEPFIPRQPAIMWALETRPKPWRIVNETPDEGSESQTMATQDVSVMNEVRQGPLDPHEKIFSGDALSRFVSARFDPNAPFMPVDFDDEYSEVELEVVSTGDDPDLEAERLALIAAHPEGKPIKTFRYGGKKPPDDE